MIEDRFTNTVEDAARFERDRAIDAGEFDRPDPSEYEDREGCQMCGCHPDDPCDCFDPQDGP